MTTMQTVSIGTVRKIYETICITQPYYRLYSVDHLLNLAENEWVKGDLD